MEAGVSIQGFVTFAIFIVVLITFVVSTPVYLRWLFSFYHSLETYHEPKEEGFNTKLRKLFIYNGLVATFATGVSIVYVPFLSGLGIPFTTRVLFAVPIIITVVNLTVRRTAYGYTEEPDPSHPVIRLKEDVHNTAYSFMTSLWYLMFIGIELNVIHRNIVWEYELPTVEPPIGLIMALGLLTIVYLLIYFNEVWLKDYRHVPGEIVDDLEGPAIDCPYCSTERAPRRLTRHILTEHSDKFDSGD